MGNRFGKFKILSIIAAVLLILLLSTLRAGSPDRYSYPVSATEPDSTGLTTSAESNITAPIGDASGKRFKNPEYINLPAMTVLKSEGVSVRSVDLLKDGKYPVFNVTFPFEFSIENENRITNIINQAAKANSWMDFEIVDSAADIRIDVTCDRQFNMVDEVKINGDVNYFLKLSQEKAVRSYSYIKPISFRPKGEVLGILSSGGWEKSSLQELLGAGDGSFDGYDVYFNRGISVKYSGDRIYNIVFGSSGKDPALGKIGFNGGRRQVVELLGAPQFESAGQELYGYKTTDFYIFFTGTEKIREISVYSRYTAYDKNTLSVLLGKYGGVSDKFDLYSFVEGLKTEWPGYDLYYSERGGLGISYDSIGISIDNMYEDRGGPYITVYGNFEGKITPELELPGKTDNLGDYRNDALMLQLDTDKVFEKEKQRLERKAYLSTRKQAEGIVCPDGSIKVLDNEGGTYEHAGLFIFSMDGLRPDTEIRTGYFAHKVLWIDNRYFVYDVYMNGIFAYDTKGRKIMEVLLSNLEKNADYELVSCGSGIVSARNAADDSVTEKKYSIAADGTLIFE